MTERKGLKKVVRERMGRTGESYTTAHRQVAHPRRPAGLVPGYPRFGRESHHDSSLVRHVLAQAGLPLSEAMVCGLGGGIGFLYATFAYAGLPHPLLTIVAQHHPAPWAPEVLNRLGVAHTEQHSSSTAAALTKLRRCLESDRPALCTVDRTQLPWHPGRSVMEAADPYLVVVAGLDGDTFYVDDRDPEPHAIDAAAFGTAWAGHKKGRHAMLALDGPVGPVDLSGAVTSAVATTVAHLTGPVLGNAFDVNLGLRGLSKLATELGGTGRTSWAHRFGSEVGFAHAMARLDECLQREYTAPDATRPLYADFLDEAAALSPVDPSAARLFRQSATSWAAITAEARTASDPAAAFPRLAEHVQTALALETAAVNVVAAALRKG
jgi:hypothetical protein